MLQLKIRRKRKKRRKGKKSTKKVKRYALNKFVDGINKFDDTKEDDDTLGMSERRGGNGIITRSKRRKKIQCVGQWGRACWVGIQYIYYKMITI